jgi:hypothetical protein
MISLVPGGKRRSCLGRGVKRKQSARVLSKERAKAVRTALAYRNYGCELEAAFTVTPGVNLICSIGYPQRVQGRPGTAPPSSCRCII